MTRVVCPDCGNRKAPGSIRCITCRRSPTVIHLKAENEMLLMLAKDLSAQLGQVKAENERLRQFCPDQAERGEQGKP